MERGVENSQMVRGAWKQRGKLVFADKDQRHIVVMLLVPVIFHNKKGNSPMEIGAEHTLRADVKRIDHPVI